MARTSTAVATQDQTRKWIMGVAFVCLLATVMTPLLARGHEATPALTPAGVLDSQPANLACDDTAATPVPPAAAVYSIIPAESEARYVAEEELAGRGAATAVGKTKAFIGQILLDKDGIAMPCSVIYIDLRTLQSDESRRDNYLYNNTLESERYPLASFIVSSVEGMTGALEEGSEAQVVLVGDLTLHGVTKVVAWAADVTLKDGKIVGTAVTVFTMSDFGIVPPTVGPVLSLDDEVVLEVDLSAELVK